MEPWNAPPPGAKPTMDGFVTDYISTFTAEMGRQPTYDEYAQIMTGFSPEQVPVLSGIARDFGVFDHWFSEVPSQTFMNRSFWTAATSSGLVVNSPAKKWLEKNDAETIFERLEAHGKTWKVYVDQPMPLSFAGSSTTPASRTGWRRTSCPSPSSSATPQPGRCRFLADRTEHADRPRRLPPGAGRSLIAGGVDLGIDSPSSSWAARRSWSVSTTLPLVHIRVWHQRLEHRASDRLGRPAAPTTTSRRGRLAARSGCTRRRVRLHVCSFRLPRPGDHGVALGRVGLGLQRGVPPHLADRDSA